MPSNNTDLGQQPQPQLYYVFSGEQYTPQWLALTVQWQDNPTFLAWGGDNTFFQPSAAYQYNTSGNVGQVQGRNTTDPSQPNFMQPSMEDMQLASLAPVKRYIVTHPAEVVAWQKKFGYGFQSPNDPNYFIPYYAVEKDMAYVSSALDQAVPFNSIVSSMGSYGYPDTSKADHIIMICSNYRQAIRGSSSNWQVTAQALGFPYLYQISDPMFAINPYTPDQQIALAKQDAGFVQSPTGTFSLGSTNYTNTLGGEVVNLCFPFADKNTESVGSLIANALLTYFGQQSQAQLYGIHSNFDGIIANALPDVSTRMYTYCQQNGLTFGDFFSPTPFTAAQKQFLSQSQYYNPTGIHPPTFAGCIAEAILASPLTGIGPWVPFAQSPSTGATYEQKNSYYARNPDFIAYVLKNMAHGLHLWMQASKLPVIPDKSLLQPFADLYDK
jgi:hypothetical protein